MPSPSVALLRTQTDERLAALAASGHERAFEAIVERYRRSLIRSARRYVHRTSLNALRVQGYDYEELRETLEGGGGPAEAAERRAVVRGTLAGLAALPPRQRDALLQIAVEGRSQDEVAADLGLSQNAGTLTGKVTDETRLKCDSDDDDECPADALRVGANVKEAELKVTSQGRVWEELELR